MVLLLFFVRSGSVFQFEGMMNQAQSPTNTSPSRHSSTSGQSKFCYRKILFIFVDMCKRSCQISANQHEAETIANVNKHWKKHAKGSGIISNVISVNQHFASTFSMQIFKFFYLPGELVRRLLWELIQAMNNHVHITINSWWWEWNGIRWWIKPIKSNFIQNIAKVCIRNHSIIPRDSRRQIQKAILQEGFDTVI